MADLNDDLVASLENSDIGPVLILRGELDASSADDARATMDRALDLASDVVVIDMSGLSFMDSSGIALLVRAANRVDRVVLREPNDMIRRVIDITGLSSVFEIDP